MSTDILASLFEHNDWATLRVVEACTALTDEQLDALPVPGSPWSVRLAITHLVESQRGYLSLLTLPPDAREAPSIPLADLAEVARTTGAALRELAQRAAELPAIVHTTDGFTVEPWVVLVQVINHATDHRRQVRGLLRAQGLTPPDVDGWQYGEHTGSLVPVPS